VVPIVATRPDSTRFVIDVKNYKDATTKREVTGKDEGMLVGPNGKPFNPDPLPLLAKIAHELGATPVLWLPEATGNRSLRLQGSNLIVVMGSARHLKHALLGAEVDTPRHAPPALPRIPERRKKPRAAAEAKPTARIWRAPKRASASGSPGCGSRGRSAMPSDRSAWSPAGASHRLRAARCHTP